MSELKGKRVLVTGASGFIGSHLLDRLTTLGAIVFAAHCRDTRHTAHDGCHWLRFDLLCQEQTFAALELARPEFVFHLAGNPDASESHAQALASLHANTCMTLNLLEACRSVGTRNVIYADSCKVYGNGQVPYLSTHPAQPLCSYAIGKLAGWELCLLYHRLYGLDVVSIRPTLIYGPGQGRNLISTILDRLHAGERRIDLLGGNQTRDPLYVEDAVRAFVLAAENSPLLTGEVINIGGGEEQTVYALAQQVVQACGTPATVETRPTSLRPNDTLRSFCDNQEARERLGWRPLISFAAGLHSTVQARYQPVPQHLPMEA